MCNIENFERFISFPRLGKELGRFKWPEHMPSEVIRNYIQDAFRVRCNSTMTEIRCPDVSYPRMFSIHEEFDLMGIHFYSLLKLSGFGMQMEMECPSEKTVTKEMIDSKHTETSTEDEEYNIFRRVIFLHEYKKRVNFIKWVIFEEDVATEKLDEEEDQAWCARFDPAWPC
jgi:hypothetical protein